MAKIAQKPQQPQDSAAQAAEDLATVFPETTLVIAGQSITVHEYAFVQWIRLKADHKELIEALTALVGSADEVSADELLEVFEDQFHKLYFLLEESIHEQHSDFLDKLTDAEMQQLMLVWWQVNKHFFLRAIYRTLRKKAKTTSQSDGPTSSSV